MEISSHRLKAQEKRLYHKLVKTVIFSILLVIIIIYIGLPLFAKFIVFISPKSKDNPTANVSTTILFPPLLDPQFEATNTATIVVSGIGDEDTTVKLFVNDKIRVEQPADDDGRFNFKQVKLAQGKNTIYVTSFKDNNESSPSSPLIIEYKTEEPKLEVNSPEDGKRYTDDREITVQGQTDPGNNIIINDRHTVTDADGKFRYRIRLNDGENIIQIIALDNAGNQTQLERKVTYAP